ncbi:hypothetical protein Sjap_001926 [Stephania japonica]|uniref:Uncharacterized protein n=1 Tax=Stephania japonica TaxID=461633 RepID=A0AAP0KKV3_9MAGN
MPFNKEYPRMILSPLALGSETETPLLKNGSLSGTSSTYKSILSKSPNTKVSAVQKVFERSFTSTSMSKSLNIYGWVGGFTNTKDWSSLLSCCSSSGLVKVTSISFLASSSKFVP